MSEKPAVQKNLDDLKVKQNLMALVGRMHGLHNVITVEDSFGVKELRLKKCVKERTLSQNDTYWGMIVPRAMECFSEDWGYQVSEEEAHETLAERHLFQERRIVNRRTGEYEWVRNRRSTTTLDTREFSEYFTACRDFLAEFYGVLIPDPDPALAVGRTGRRRAK